MTRDEAIKIFRYEVDRQQKFSEFGYSFENLLNEIYDHFESKTCESCKHFNNCVIDKEVEMWCNKAIDNNFGCNQWESKDD
jgi:hypothetical protein